MSVNPAVLEPLSPHLFWDVDRDQIDVNDHADFLIRRVVERGTREDVLLVWDTYGADRIESALTTAPALSRKTISFFAHQFSIPREAFRAYRHPPQNWDA